MNEGETLSHIQILWERVFRIVSTKDVILSSVIGLCGYGLFWSTRQWLGLTQYEQELIKLRGIALSTD